MYSKNLWWGYLHVNGEIQAKRFFNYEDIQDAKDSVFVKKIFEPVKCSSKEEAINNFKLLCQQQNT